MTMSKARLIVELCMLQSFSENDPILFDPLFHTRQCRYKAKESDLILLCDQGLGGPNSFDGFTYF